MKTILRPTIIWLLFLQGLCLLFFSADTRSETFSEEERTALKVCEGVIQLFEQFQEEVWPGYNLAERPFIFYIPEKWALLFNYSGEIEDFTPYPEDWPGLGTQVLFHQGSLEGLVGQLAFDVEIDSVEMVAVPFMDKPAVDLFAFIVHEGFHQYQHEAFGDIPWQREEKYPIQDSVNTALACLEMHLLMDALRAMKVDDAERCREYAKQFAAVRKKRWNRDETYLAKYEQGQEINEGTAKYVELNSIDLMTRLTYHSSLSGVTSSLLDNFASISMPEYLLDEFQNRMEGISISPEDMSRNRIYPVGSAQGFLLDYLGVIWKSKAQQAGTEFAFARLIEDELGVTEEELEELCDEAKKRYGYKEILAATRKLIKEYTEGFESELETFEAQPGYRIAIDVNTNGLSRSRSSYAKKWIIDQGRRELRSHYNVYVLKRGNLHLQIHDTGIFEGNDWDARRREVVFFIPEIDTLIIDNHPLDLSEHGRHDFERIELQGEGVDLDYTVSGVVEIGKGSIGIESIP